MHMIENISVPIRRVYVSVAVIPFDGSHDDTVDDDQCVIESVRFSRHVLARHFGG